MQVDVLEVMARQARKKRLRVAGGNGNLCRPYITEFPVGTEWVLGLYRAAKIDAVTDYSIKDCGTFWLQVVGGDMVEGNVDEEKRGDAVQQNTLDELRRRLSDAKSR
jgi:hypothetical protein